MALRARQIQEQFPQERRIKQPQPPRKRKVQRQPKKKNKFSKGEIVLLIVSMLVIVLLSMVLLNKNSQIDILNNEVYQLEQTIQDKQKENTKYEIQVKERSTQEHILKKAKERGLDLNESNVKVVPGQ